LKRKTEGGMRKSNPSSSDRAGLPSSPSATPRLYAAAKDAEGGKAEKKKVES